MPGHVKRRGRPEPGSIAEALDIFGSEVRFYRQIASEAGVRVPACYLAADEPGGTLLVLEDLSGWAPGADPAAAARVLAGMHARWAGRAALRWPWLRPVGAAVDLVEDLYRRTWPDLARRGDLPPAVRELGGKLLGKVTESEFTAGRAGPLTLVHGDASAANMRTSTTGEIALLDWEDVSAAPGIGDLAWLLVSSVEPARWQEVASAYGSAERLLDALPAAAVQGLLSLSDSPEGSAAAAGWNARLMSAAARLRAQ